MNAPRRPPRRRVDGVLLLDKPLGMTSNAALQKARWLFNAAKAGHTGTLDPLASGLLPLCFGEATKFAGGLLDADKTYEARVQLGVTTTTADAEGEVLERREVVLTEPQLETVLARFVGDIEQLPPMYSALKRDGRPLYEYARAGVEVERTPRQVRIHALELLDWQGTQFSMRVRCSKGTYIRTLAEDIGAALGCGAHLAALRRTQIADLHLVPAVTLAQLEALPPAARDALLAPVDTLVSQWPGIELSAAERSRLMQGQSVCPVTLLAETFPGGVTAWRRAYHQGQFLGLCVLQDGQLHPRRLMVPAT